jgi:hypothetical protein
VAIQAILVKLPHQNNQKSDFGKAARSALTRDMLCSFGIT